MRKKMLFLISFVSLLSGLKAQNAIPSDSLFKMARDVAFEQHNYAKAKQLSLQALNISPSYSDIQVFLGRIHTWSKDYDSARYYFKNVLDAQPSNEDAGVAYTDLEYWNEDYSRALRICDSALTDHPQSEALLIRKAKILKAQKQYTKAGNIIKQLLIDNKNNAEAKALGLAIKNETSANKITISYDHTSFDKQYDKSWHLASFFYSRQTKYGSYIARLNYANRFNTNGVQSELDAYPRISKTFYSYINFGYSSAESIFPKYRAGLSLYANLPRSFEAEVGLRYLYFNESTNIYTFYLGKYYKSFLFSTRTYIVPSNTAASQSFSLGARYYLKGADDYIGANVGTGISPDDNVQNIQFNAKHQKLSSKQASVSLNHTFLKWNILSLSAGIINREYQLNTNGNQLNISCGLSRRF